MQGQCHAWGGAEPGQPAVLPEDFLGQPHQCSSRYLSVTDVPNTCHTQLDTQLVKVRDISHTFKEPVLQEGESEE